MWASQKEIREQFHATTMVCSCPPYCPNPWDADPDCQVHGEEIQRSMREEAEAEIWAENAWLRAAEADYMNAEEADDYRNEFEDIEF